MFRTRSLTQEDKLVLYIENILTLTFFEITSIKNVSSYLSEKRDRVPYKCCGYGNYPYLLQESSRSYEHVVVRCKILNIIVAGVIVTSGL